MPTKKNTKAKPGKGGSKTKKSIGYDKPDISTRFQPGNRFWTARSSHGRKPIFTDPDQFYTACMEYFEWANNNPLLEDKVFCNGGEIIRTTIAHPIYTTIQGLCIYLDISRQTWDNYKANPDFLETIGIVEDMLWQNKLELTAAEFLNSNIVCREMGLRDKQEVDVNQRMQIVSHDPIKKPQDSGI